jgi:competence protein ComEC
VPEPQASLLTGILLGDDAGIPKSVQEAFRTTGTSHVIAISG